jgi:hypothetical protein
MPWNNLYAPLDRTIDQLEWLANQIRADLLVGAEITPDDYRSVLIFIENIMGQLRPLQDLPIQERR